MRVQKAVCVVQRTARASVIRPRASNSILRARARGSRPIATSLHARGCREFSKNHARICPTRSRPPRARSTRRSRRLSRRGIERPLPRRLPRPRHAPSAASSPDVVVVTRRRAIEVEASCTRGDSSTGHDSSKDIVLDPTHGGRRPRPRLPSLDAMRGANGAVKPLPKYKLVFLGVRVRPLDRSIARATSDASRETMRARERERRCVTRD